MQPSRSSRTRWARSATDCAGAAPNASPAVTPRAVTSGPVITKLTETWKAEQRAFAARDLSGVDYVYVWADGIHVNIRLQEHKLCLLVIIGVRADGRKETHRRVL